MESRLSLEWLHEWMRKSIGLKLIMMGFLLLVLLIPASMINSTIQERKSSESTAQYEISSKWGTAQVVSGPWLTIPYYVYSKGPKGERQQQIFHAYFLPDDLTIGGDLDTELRYRGIYEAVLYKSSLHLSGHFPAPDFQALNVPLENVIWNQAVVGFGLTDMRGIRANLNLEWNGKTLPLEPGIQVGNLSASGVSVKLPAGSASKATFTIDLKLNGSGSLSFLPFGKTTTVSLKSPWSSPSFSGSFLPTERQITSQGFQAQWQVLHLNRNYPQAWLNDRPAVDESAFGVELFLPDDQYQKTTRSTKYAVMFLLLTFGALFFMEIREGHPVHVIQYLLVGLAMVFFYSLLLSLAEHIGFNAAYGVSSVAIVAMIALYAKGIFGRPSVTLTVGALISALYGYLYILLQIEDYALLVGNIGLFLALSTAMYVSRRTDWYSK